MRSGSATSIRFRMGAFTALLLAVLVALGAIAVVSAQMVRDRLDQESQTIGPARSANATLISRLRAAERSLSTFLVVRDAYRSGAAPPGSQEQVLLPLREALRLMPSDLDRLGQFAAQGIYGAEAEAAASQLAGLVAEQRTDMLAWAEWAGQHVENLTTNPAAVAPSAAEIQRGGRLFQEATRGNAAVQASLDAINDSVRAAALAGLDRARVVVIVATAGALVLAVLVAWRATAALVTPLQRLGEVVRAQRSGERNAWADPGRGAREVRSLAEDVNALNREHLRLVDKQAQSLALLRAGNDVVALIGRVPGPQEAAALAAEAVGLALGVDAARVAGWTVAGEQYCAAWSRDREVQVRVPDSWWQGGESGFGQLLPAGDLIRAGTGQHPVVPLPPWVRDDPAVIASTSALFIPVALADRVWGLVSLHSWDGEREWEEPEIAYLERVARELARRGSRPPDSAGM